MCIVLQRIGRVCDYYEDDEDHCGWWIKGIVKACRFILVCGKNNKI